jgi:mono/diheme cytochrome c family protein
MRRTSGWKPALLCVLGLAACQQDMADQGRIKPLDPNPFFADGRSSRHPVAGTVARGQERADEHLYTGRVGGQLTDSFPFPIPREKLERGRQRFNIYCSPCHGQDGAGRGMIVRRGFPPPPTFHSERLRQAPAGHYFEVMTKGFGVMYDYAERVNVEDRWHIAAYIRALQLSQNARLDDVPEPERAALQGSGAP